jgi:homoserine O-acetyltransferase
MARMVSQITFRSEDLFADRFGREVVEPIEGFELWQRFQVERYLEYHGDKLARRFDANSYLLLTKAMDLHDLGRGRGGMDIAVRRITAPTLVMGVDSDFLYPTYQQETIAGALLGNGVDVRYVEVHSPHGHDGFLLETEQVGRPLHDFLIDVEKSQ